MLPSTRSIFLSKKALAIYAIEAFLLIVSLYGFVRGAHDVLFFTEGSHPIMMLTLLGVLPCTLFVVIAVRHLVLATQQWSSWGFQFRIDELQKRLNAQDDFYRSISSHMATTMTIYDADNRYWFVNASAVRELGVSENDVLGRRPMDFLPLERARSIVKAIETVRRTGHSCEVLDQYVDKNGAIRHWQTSYQSIEPFGDFPGGIMARGDDVSSIVMERERREMMLKQVISTLVAVVDRRDPFAAGHSAHVGFIARSIASEMRLPQRDVEAAEIAGSLMNFGKVMVSRSILTKIDPLTADELQRVRDSILTSADILSLIDFGAPVVATLRQVLERYDGTGFPQRLSGDAILLTARIVSVANAFVAMVSPRAYRPGLSAKPALVRLEQEADLAYDPQVIDALDRYLNTHAAKIEWLNGKAKEQPVS